MRYPLAQDFGSVANELLAADETRRFLANEVLANMMLLFQISEDNDQIKTLARESGHFITHRATFIPALVSYWANTCQTIHLNWMAPFEKRAVKQQKTSKTATESWYSLYEQHYPIIQPCEDKGIKPVMPLLIGMQGWLENAVGPEDTALIPQLIACLDHPEMVCQDTAVKMLGAIGHQGHASEVFKPAIRALQQRIAEKGAWCRPFIDGTALVTIIGDHIDTWLEMTDHITSASSLEQVQGYCACFELIPEPPIALIDRLLAISETIPARQQDILHSLFSCIALLAHRTHYRCQDIHTIILPLVTSPSDISRRTVASVLGYVGQFPEDEPLLIQLSQDPEDLVRVYAHRAALNIPDPSSALIEITARDLNNYDLYDGMPHDDAVDTLAGWEVDILPAFDHIKRWLTAVVEEPSYYTKLNTQELKLIEQLGNYAKPLLPLLQQLYNAYFSEDEDIEDADDEDETQEEESTAFEEDADTFDGHSLQDKMEALTIIQTHLQNSATEIQAIDDHDEDLDHEALAAIKAWETRASPFMAHLLHLLKQGEITIDADMNTKIKQLVNEGEKLFMRLLAKSAAKIFSDLDMDQVNGDSSYDHKEALIRSFMEEMKVSKIELSDIDIPLESDLPSLLALIEQLQK